MTAEMFSCPLHCPKRSKFWYVLSALNLDSKSLGQTGPAPRDGFKCGSGGNRRKSHNGPGRNDSIQASRRGGRCLRELCVEDFYKCVAA